MIILWNIPVIIVMFVIYLLCLYASIYQHVNAVQVATQIKFIPIKMLLKRRGGGGVFFCFYF